MIVVMESNATEDDVQNVMNFLEKNDFDTHLSEGTQRTIVGVIGDTRKLDRNTLEVLDHVDQVLKVQKPFKRASREFHPQDTVVQVEDTAVGTDEIVLMAGPCSVENREQLLKSARAVKNAGAKVLRGGAFKPRTSPYSFQGLGKEGLELLRDVGDEVGLKVVTEVMGPKQVELVGQFTDVFQIGARNMQNYNLLREVGEYGKPVLLKRGFHAKINELLLAAEYILDQGNEDVMLCERGIRSFDNEHTRNALDINSVPVLKDLTHLPVIVDPSHAAGKREFVPAGARAAVAAGADGLLVEVHPEPARALSDGPQQLQPELFEQMVGQISMIAEAMGRTIDTDITGRPMETESTSEPAAIA